MSRQSSRSGRQTPVGGFGSKSRAGRGFGGFSLSSSAGSDLSYLAEPPDLSAISDPQVVVSCKNLLKKDSITKARALEELLAYAKAHPFEQDGGPEEPVLEAWVKIYPATSIDNSRRVRELAHSLQYEFMKAARKRMERHVPKVVGPWLAGLYDRDRIVARVANDGLSSFLNSPEKTILFWKKCQPQILQFATGAIRETKDSLSDERSTTPEDAESKYFRVLGAALSLVLALLQKLSGEDMSKAQESYDEFLNEDIVWKCINIGDSSVRKSACQLLEICLDKRKTVLEEKMSRLKKVLISEGLKANHTGSAAQFVKALSTFTSVFPNVWQPSSGDKKTPVSRLNHFLGKGSQGSEATMFWDSLQALLKNLPKEELPLDVTTALAKSMRSGISNREEPQSNALIAWRSYLQVTRSFMTLLPSGPDQVSFAGEALFPLVEHYLQPTGASAWSIAGPSAPTIVEACYAVTTESAPEAVVSAANERWTQLAKDFCMRIANSLPEVSREFQKSQEAIAEEGNRWFSLIGQIQKTKSTSATGVPSTALDSPAGEIVSCCIDVLSRRNLKPFGAAKTIRRMGESTMYLGFNESITTALYDFLLQAGSEQIDLVLKSHSRLDLIAYLQLYAGKPNLQPKYEVLWKTWASQLLQESTSPDVPHTLAVLLSNTQASYLARGNDTIQKYIVDNTLESLSTGTERWELLESSLTSGALTLASIKALASGILKHLQADNRSVLRALSGLAILSKKGASLLSEDEDLYLSLVIQLLSLAEAPDQNVSSKARELHQLLDLHADGKKPTASIVRTNLDTASPQSLEIDTVIQLAVQEALANIKTLPELLPDTWIWRNDLTGLISTGVNPALSITSILGGAQFLVKASSPGEVRPPGRDRNGYSAPARMGLYLLGLIENGVDIKTLPSKILMDIILLLLVTAELGSEQLTMMEDGRLFEVMSPAVQLTADKLSSSCHKWLNGLISESTGWKEMEKEGDPGHLVFNILQALLNRSKDTTPLAFYCAKAASEIIQALTEEHGPPDNFDKFLASLYPTKEAPSAIFPVTALLRGVGQSLASPESLNTICNRLVSDAAGAKPVSEKALATLVLLTCCLGFYEEGEVPVQMNRLVFAVRNVTGWFEAEGPVDPFFAAESCRLLTRLLPEIASVYGSHWENTLQYCTRIWEAAGEYPLDISMSAIHASLKLYSILESLPEPNDDLEDSLKDLAEVKAKSLIDLLKLPRETNSQPLSIIDSLLCRQVAKIPLRFLKDLSELYGLLASESRDIQTAAFTLMHRALPALQEQLSVDVLLDKESAHLPDEMMSLLLEPPTLEKYPDDVLAQFPLAVRTYLLTWHLIFDSYSTASLGVRNDYTEDLKSGNYISPLLDFIFDVLGHSIAHPINLDKEGFTTEHIRAYDIKVADSEPDERDMHWLLIHIYYLCLKYTPELFKTWFINCRSKQTRIAAEGWMTKYFSPIIIADALDDVARWAEAQEAGSDDEKELLVKVSRTAREVTAGYEVDEMLASITIKVPPNYPIEGITVLGTSRVVVNERKWQSWVRTTQGVITFSNGSIIDGLMTFRRNIVGALKGQTECAICYAIISSDKKMPDKRCQTCKNLFHRTCLYKWFQTSSQNTCPLCRNPIDYLGSDTRSRRMH